MDSPQNEQYVVNLINSLIQEIENKAAEVSESTFFLAKLKLAEAAKMFKAKYSTNPMQLFNYIRQCLATEMSLIQSINGEGLTGFPNLSTTNSGAQVLYQLEQLRRRTQETAEDLRRMEQEQEAFAIQYHECTKLNGEYI